MTVHEMIYHRKSFRSFTGKHVDVVCLRKAVEMTALICYHVH